MAWTAQFRASVVLTTAGALAAGTALGHGAVTDPVPIASGVVTEADHALPAIDALDRWTGYRVAFDGADLPKHQYTGQIEVEEALDNAPSLLTTKRASLSIIGDLWGMQAEDFLPTPPDPFNPPPPPPPSPPTPRSWGNKDLALYLQLGDSPLTMVEFPIFGGLSYDKQTQGDTVTTGKLGGVGYQLKYASIPLCLSVQPFSGLHRGEITRMAWAYVGGDPNKVVCPLGKKMNLPVLLSNASLLQWLNDFWLPEAMRCYIDDEGFLVVEPFALKQAADWVIDDSNSLLDSFTETPPAIAPAHYYIKASTPVTGTGPDGGDLITVTYELLEVDSGPYNPIAIKSAPHFTAGDGTYTKYAAPIHLITKMVERWTTKKNGTPIKVVTETRKMFNPAYWDETTQVDLSSAEIVLGGPDHTYGLTAYAHSTTLDSHHYADGTSHQNDYETLMLTDRVTVEYFYDVDSTGLQTQAEVRTTTEGYYAPLAGLAFAFDKTLADVNGTPCRAPFSNSPGVIGQQSWIFSDQKARSQKFEAFMPISMNRVVTTALQGGTSSTRTELHGFYARNCGVPVNVDNWLALKATGNLAFDTALWGSFRDAIGYADHRDNLNYPYTPPAGQVYDFGGGDWRADSTESFRGIIGPPPFSSVGCLASELLSYSVDLDLGLVSGSTDQFTTYDDVWGGDIARAALIPPLCFAFADTTFRLNEVFASMLSKQITKSYAYNEDGTVTVITAEHDYVRNTDTSSIMVVDQSQVPSPQWPNSPLTSLILQPVTGTLTDDCLDGHFVSQNYAFQVTYGQDGDEVTTATQLALARLSAVSRSRKIPANPLIRIGQTVFLEEVKRGVAALHMVTGLKHSWDSATGQALTEVEMEFWTRTPA